MVEAGYACVEMEDRRRIRNHLDSVHALAIANIGELTTGLAMTATLPPDVRSILTALQIEYKKKGRGRLVAQCNCVVPDVTEATEVMVTSTVTDVVGDEVARVTATWLIRPAPLFSGQEP
jgi:acyl-coenzyme A thioesterase PaaI-like protein